MGPEPGIMFTLVPIFIGVVAVIIVGVIIFSIFSGIKQWSYNNKQPVLTVFSKVVSKRSKVSTSNNNQNDHMHSSTSTTYYTTFEVESGDRIEFSMQDREFGLLAEGDQGKLSFQGTRYLSFNRETSK
jgi:hypothetical protein